jgi:hypothetical protein
MKILLLIIPMFFTITEKLIAQEKSSSQKLPTIRASIEKEDPDGPGITEFNCAHGVYVKTSIEHSAEGNIRYSGSNVLDKKDETAWCTPGLGTDQWIEFTLKENFRIGNTYQIRNGYTKSKKLWKENSRVKKLKVMVNNKTVAYILLNDTDAYQSFLIYPDGMEDEGKPGTKIRFVIEEIYGGDKYTDTLISHFVPTGNCG